MTKVDYDTTKVYCDPFGVKYHIVAYFGSPFHVDQDMHCKEIEDACREYFKIEVKSPKFLVANSEMLKFFSQTLADHAGLKNFKGMTEFKYVAPFVFPPRMILSKIDDGMPDNIFLLID